MRLDTKKSDQIQAVDSPSRYLSFEESKKNARKESALTFKPSAESTNSQHSQDYLHLGYRPYFVYRISSQDIVLTNGPEHRFCFFTFKQFKLTQVAQIENPGKQAILCAGESNQHVFVATQDKHLFVVSKSTFALIKVYSTLQLVNCLSRIDSSSGCIILIGMA